MGFYPHQYNTSHRGKTISKKPPKLSGRCHIVLPAGFTGLRSVLQSFGFEGTVVEETSVFFGGSRRSHLDL